MENVEEGNRPKVLERPAWTLWQSLAVCGAGLISAVAAFAVLSTTGMRTYVAVGFSTSEANASTIVLSCVVAACAGYLLTKLLHAEGSRGFWASIEWHYSKRDAGVAALAGLSAAILMRFAITRHVTVELLPASRMSVLFALVLLGTVIAGPLVEEVYFRGILFAGLAGRVGSVASICIVTLAFVLLHVQHRWIVLPIGILLGVLRLYKRSTANCFALHAAYNLGVVLWGIR
jgi:membrane protease YdiL (CAAX protease family)